MNKLMNVPVDKPADIPPEVIAGFVHYKYCSRRQPLEIVEFFPEIDWGGNMGEHPTFEKFVMCGECKGRVRFDE